MAQKAGATTKPSTKAPHALDKPEFLPFSQASYHSEDETFLPQMLPCDGEVSVPRRGKKQRLSSWKRRAQAKARGSAIAAQAGEADIWKASLTLAAAYAGKADIGSKVLWQIEICLPHLPLCSIRLVCVEGKFADQWPVKQLC